MKNACKVFLLSCLLICGLLPLLARAQFVFDENPLMKKQAPDFTLNLLSGQSMSLSQSRGNDPAIIFFWATWCPHCREELGTLAAETQQLVKNGIKIILVNVEENPRLVKAFIEENKLAYPVFLDQKSEISQQYGIVGLPTLFFVDKNGVVVGMEHGLPDNVLEILSVNPPKKI